MKHALLAFAFVLGFVATAPAQEAREKRLTQSVRGSQTLRVNRMLGLDHRSRDRVLDQVFLDVDTVRGNSQAQLLLAGIPVATQRIERNTRGRIPLTLPFRVIYNPGLAVDLKLDGDFVLRNVGIAFEGERVRDGGGVIGAPPPVTGQPPVVARKRLTFDAKRWATRSRTEYREGATACGKRGAGAVDGWDFPEYGCKLDGHVAIYRPDNGTTALCLEFDDLPRAAFTRVVSMKLETSLSGARGKALVTFAGKPFEDMTAQMIDVPALPGQKLVIDFGPLALTRDKIRQGEICIRSATDTQLNFDGAKLIVEVEP